MYGATGGEGAMVVRGAQVRKRRHIYLDFLLQSICDELFTFETSVGCKTAGEYGSPAAVILPGSCGDGNQEGLGPRSPREEGTNISGNESHAISSLRIPNTVNQLIYHLLEICSHSSLDKMP